MSHVSKISKRDEHSHWQPTASLDTLRKRAQLLAQIRLFFQQRDVLEVETPLLMPHTVTDEHIDSIAVPGYGYLQTSPEYAMKRLLAAGYGDLFQICKAFRAETRGRYHRNEFTLLEWYRIGYSEIQLMDELAQLLKQVCELERVTQMTYTQCFQHFYHIDPIQCSLAELRRLPSTYDLAACDRDTCLMWLFAEGIEPHLGHESPVFVTHYPASQSALAEHAIDGNTARRFEMIWQGVEIANGFYECCDPAEHERRFQADQANRVLSGKAVPTVDSGLIAALQHGLPRCAGVAVGLDRLLMLWSRQRHITSVQALSI